MNKLYNTILGLYMANSLVNSELRRREPLPSVPSKVYHSAVDYNHPCSKKRSKRKRMAKKGYVIVNG